MAGVPFRVVAGVFLPAGAGTCSPSGTDDPSLTGAGRNRVAAIVSSAASRAVAIPHEAAYRAYSSNGTPCPRAHSSTASTPAGPPASPQHTSSPTRDAPNPDHRNAAYAPKVSNTA